MGIRFLCPNGHKLNVKAFLAGERGICPQCDAKFLVPSESGGQVEAISEAAIAAAESANATASATTSPTASPNPGPTTPATASAPESRPAPPPPPAPTPPAVTPPPTPEPEQPPEVWYVRAATGEQFGPASVEVMREWVAEGRVTVECHVWRTGWPDWKTGGQAITQLNVVPPAVAPANAASPNSTADTNVETPAPAQADEPQANTPAALSAPPGELPAASNPTASYQATKRIRQERARKITLLLGVVVLILFAVLIGVLMNNR